MVFAKISDDVVTRENH